MPQLEHQQHPDLCRMIPSASRMFVQETSDSFGIEIATPQGSGLKQDRQQIVLELASHPVHQRKSKSLFGSIKNLLRHTDAGSQFFQQTLAPSVLEF